MISYVGLPSLESSSFLSQIFQSACNHKLQGIKDELKHIDRSLRQNSPEYNKVLRF